MMTHNTNSLGLIISNGIEWIDSSILFKDTLFYGCPFELYAVYPYWHEAVADIDARYNKNKGNVFYKPFKISVTNGYSHWGIQDLRRSFCHDIVHALDFFMRGQQDRLLKPEFGFSFTRRNKWTRKGYELEENVLAIQHAILSASGDTKCNHYYAEACVYLWNQIEDYEEELPYNYVSTSIQNKFEYWQDNLNVLKSCYEEMIDWCNIHKGRYDARERFVANA